MQVKGLDLYLNPTEADVARSLGLPFEKTSAGGFYKLIKCSDIEHRDRVINRIMQGVNEQVESEWRNKWNI